MNSRDIFMTSIFSAGRPVCILICFFTGIFSVFSQAPLRMAVVREGKKNTVNVDLAFLAAGDYFFWTFADSTDISKIGETGNSPLEKWALYSSPRYREAFDTFDCYQRYLLEEAPSAADSPEVHTRGGVLPVMSAPKQEKSLPRGGNDNADIRFFRWGEQGSPYWQEDFFPEEWLSGKWILLVSLREETSGAVPVLQFQTDHSDFESPCWYRNEKKQEFSGWELYTLDTSAAVVPAGAGFFSQEEVVPVPLSVIGKKQEFGHVLRSEIYEHAPAVLYSWDIGSASLYKCDPCNGPPPLFSEISGLYAVPPVTARHYYFTRTDGALPEKWFLSRRDFYTYQIIFEGTHRSKGFLNCPETERYLKDAAVREQLERSTLKELVGEINALIFN
jgi:hypothetical protein